MPRIIEDRVFETSTTTGTGPFALAGAIAGFRAFSAVCAVSDTAPYFIEAVDDTGIPTGAFETGTGTYSGTNTLTRTTVSRSSNANAAVNFGAGLKRVAISMLAADAAGGAGTVTSVSGAGTVNGITLTGTVTTSGSLALGGALSGVSLTTQVTGTLPVANGGTGATTAAAALTTLGAYAASNPSGYTTNTGTVTSVSGTGTINGITLTGTVTAAGDLTLGGALSNVSLTTQVTGVLPVARGGTAASNVTQARTNLGGTTLGSNLFIIANPSAVTFPRFNADNTASSLDAGAFRTAIGAGVRSNFQNVLSASKTLGSADNGTNLLIVTSGITITFPSTGFGSGEGFAISNISGGNVTLSTPGGADFGATLPNNGSLLVFSDGGGFWRQYCYSTSRL